MRFVRNALISASYVRTTTQSSHNTVALGLRVFSVIFVTDSYGQHSAPTRAGIGLPSQFVSNKHKHV